LTVNTVRTPSQLATVTVTNGTGITRQALQLQLRLPLVFIACIDVADDRFQASTLLSVLGDQLFALQLAINHALLSHLPALYLRKGKLNARSNAAPSSFERAVVVMVISIPRILSTLSYSISGKMICSRTPML